MQRTIEDFIGNTPLVRLQRIPGEEAARNGNVILAKLEGNNPAGSVKDRPAISMIRRAEERGRIKPGDTLIEPTSGNTGIGLAMAAAIRGYRMLLIMPENQTAERKRTMRAFGAELILTPKGGGMEGARDLAQKMVERGQGHHARPVRQSGQSAVALRDHRPRDLARHAGQDHPFRLEHGHHRHHHGMLALLQGKNPKIEIVGCQPQEGAQIPGIRKWPEAYLPKIYDKLRVDKLEYVGQAEAEEMTRRMAREEGIFAGISSGGALHVALRLARSLKNATIVCIVCDRGDRYLSSGVFPD